MVKIKGMREPSETDKIQAPSIPEIKEGFVSASMRLGRTIKFRGRSFDPARW